MVEGGNSRQGLLVGRQLFPSGPLWPGSSEVTWLASAESPCISAVWSASYCRMGPVSCWTEWQVGARASPRPVSTCGLGKQVCVEWGRRGAVCTCCKVVWWGSPVLCTAWHVGREGHLGRQTSSVLAGPGWCQGISCTSAGTGWIRKVGESYEKILSGTKFILDKKFRGHIPMFISLKICDFENLCLRLFSFTFEGSMYTCFHMT